MLHAGDVLAGRYQLLERVGGGGMGDVWRGEDLLLRRTVAVKVLLAKLADERNFRERFLREAQAIATLEGPGIVDVYDFGEEVVANGTISYLVMQFVDGMALSRRLAGWGRLNTQDTLRIVSQVADSLEIAHRSGIIHRDVKPGNILVREDGRVVLVDFGIARTETNLTMTTTGVVLGTVTYMSPEQASGEKLGPASDIYSLGVVAHQCLAGHPPFKADTPLGVLSAHLRNVPPRLPADVPQPVPNLILRAMAKEPHARWQTAGEFADACRGATAEPVTPVPELAGAVTTVIPRVRQPGPVAAAAPIPATAAPLPQIGFDAPRQRTGPPTPPPPTPPEETTGGQKPPKRRRTKYLVYIAALILVLLGTATMTLWPLDHISSNLPGAVDEASRSAGAPGGQDDAQPGGKGDSGSKEKSKKKKKSPSPGAKDSGSASDEASTSASSPVPDTVAVPDVINKTEADARSALTAADLRPAIIYEGEGDNICSVISQDPPGGRQLKRGSTVTVTVRKAKEGCDKN
ncbi:protein kinase domain-containing protein [Stackebrandtia nassauensis]|uniref:non-specific serine/threonine protein kinase n=1 Tax=Stackebrandtia nassauensis (strain DSM 44728 / CIP 108903 / NRRL B-16338 / NBRC 102104 / LLR-40K-21) TaxID=446470 RepID=D3QAW9_STANL|nr:protein kinase [Stackebrandtia nassauensis]ADD44765.1 serine/threonine protein kinase with PASTA sensor(s) [Stackebrandtia nassauensis DSM 44728]